MEKHSLSYENNLIVITGVVSVEKFDANSVLLRLQDGVLEIFGGGFVLKDMVQGSGKVSFEGTLRSLSYKEKIEAVSLLKRLFK